MIQSTTLTQENFPALNFGNFKKRLVNMCFVQMVKDSNWTTPHIEGDIQHEYTGELHFVYFTSNDKYKPNKMHRYHMIVFSMLLFESIYTCSNVIDGDKDYTLADVKQQYKNYITTLYNDLKNIK